MSVLMMLELEHANFAKLLAVLERELRELEHDREPDFDVLRATAEYWRDYPERCHHPKEELMLRRMHAGGVAGASALREATVREHEALNRLSNALVEALDTPDRPGLAAILREFIDTNRAHMEREQAHLFPLASRTLAPRDWEEIEFNLLDRPDPVFDRSAEARFHILLDAIVAAEATLEAEARSRTLREQLARGRTEDLDAIRTVEDFNEVLGEGCFPGRAHLSGDASQGFVLEREGHRSVVIGPCPVQQATWCAYYYLLGAHRG